MRTLHNIVPLARYGDLSFAQPLSVILARFGEPVQKVGAGNLYAYYWLTPMLCCGFINDLCVSVERSGSGVLWGVELFELPKPELERFFASHNCAVKSKLIENTCFQDGTEESEDDISWWRFDVECLRLSLCLRKSDGRPSAINADAAKSLRDDVIF